MSKRKKHEVSVTWPNGRPDSIILPICIRSPGVQGGKFLKTLEAIKDIPNIHVVLCDLLDRHNLVGMFEDPRVMSVKLADRWLEEYEPHLKRLIPQHSLTRWAEIQEHPNFQKRLKAVAEAYQAGGEIKTMIDNMAMYYYVRKKERVEKQGLLLNRVDELQRSAAYLQEEMAGDMTYGEMFPNAPRVYWGLYVGDPDIFNRNLPEIGCSRDFPPTAPLEISTLPPSVGTHMLDRNNIAAALHYRAA